MGHSFEVDIAVKYGVNAAILLNNIYFWCQKNKANKHNYFDGSYWTYNSRSAFTEIFPYFSERQIKTALDKLIADGVIKIGCYNKNVWDKSLWYALTDKGWSIMQERRVDLSEMSNRSDTNVRPIPDTKTTDLNPYSKPDKNTSVYDDEFNAFWAVYPRGDDKRKAFMAWKALNPSKELQQIIIADIRRRLEVGGAWYKTQKRYILLATTYLHNKRWEDEGGVTEVAEHREPDRIVLTDEEQREIERIYAQNGRDAFM